MFVECVYVIITCSLCNSRFQKQIRSFKSAIKFVSDFSHQRNNKKKVLFSLEENRLKEAWGQILISLSVVFSRIVGNMLDLH